SRSVRRVRHFRREEVARSRRTCARRTATSSFKSRSISARRARIVSIWLSRVCNWYNAAVWFTGPPRDDAGHGWAVGAEYVHCLIRVGMGFTYITLQWALYYRAETASNRPARRPRASQ